ncbi:MAG: hypothetical protein WC314_11610 [Vulcanimicrobiota bacterium]
MNYVSHKPVYREFLQNGTPVLRRKDRYVVKRNEEDGWDFVGHKAGSVPKDELSQNYGLWRDKEITEGELCWKKTVRPLDGKIQDDEVFSMAWVMSLHHDQHVHRNTNGDQGLYKRLMAENVTLNMPEGSSLGTLDTQWHTSQERWFRYGYGLSQDNTYLVLA